MSLKRRLMVLVLGAFVTSWGSLIGLTFIKAHHEVDELFDATLVLTTRLLSQYALASRTSLGAFPDFTPPVHEYENKVCFQLWRNDRLIARSENAPDTPLGRGIGFTRIQFGGEHWRVFGKIMPGDEILYVAESHAIRDELIEYLTWSSALPIVLFLPLAGALVWLAINRALRPLQRVAGEIDQRSPDQLDPLQESSVPEEIRPITKTLNRLFGCLREAFEKERRFTSDAAHELRTPLTIIKTHAQVAARSRDMDEARPAITRIIEGVDRSAHLVTQLLTLARLDPEHPNVEFGHCPLVQIAQGVIGEMVDIAGEQSISLSLHTDPPTVEGLLNGYEPGLRILLRNLLDNAIKYSDGGGEVRILIREENGGIHCTVSDDGPGIPESERQRVLERFYRPAGQKRYGAGLGLSIVSRICELHGAELSLGAGEGGKGLSVTIGFPGTATAR